MNLDELTFTICGDEARAYADTVFLPVDVSDKDGNHVLKHEVALKAEFYRELRALPDWIDQLHKICQSRVLTVLRARQQKTPINIQDKLELFDAPPRKII